MRFFKGGKKRQAGCLTEIVDGLLKSPAVSGAPVEDFYLKTRPDTDDVVWWGGEWYPVSWLRHMLTIGLTGAGKTLLTHITLASVLESIAPGTDRRVVIFDTKGDTLGLLEGLGIKYTLMNINDVRASSWDIAADFQDYDKVIELAHILLPQRGGGESVFFQDAARDIISAIIMSFIFRHGRFWGLHDVFNAALSDVETLKEIILRYPRGQDVINAYFDTEADETLDNIRMQIATQLLPLMLPAAHSQWGAKKGRTFSLTEFLSSEGVLVVGQDVTAREASNPLIRAMFHRLIQLLSGSREVKLDKETERTFIFLDEARFFGKMPGLLDALTFTRSKGGIVSIDVQGKEGFSSVYGEQAATEIFNSCKYITLLQVRGQQTVQWCQSLFGTVERHEENLSTSYGSQGVSVTSNLQRYTRPMFFDSDFLSISEPSREYGLDGFFISPDFTGDPRLHLPGDELEALKPFIKKVPSQLSKPKHVKLPQPWTEKERERLVFGRTVRKVARPKNRYCSPKAVYSELSSEIRRCMEESLVGDVWNQVYEVYNRLVT